MTRTGLRGTACWLGGLAAVMLGSTLAAAEAPRIAVMHNASNDDGGFNRLISEGVRAFEQQRGIKVTYYDAVLPHVAEDLIRSLDRAMDEGAEAVVFAGTATGEGLPAIVARYPERRFVALDIGVDELDGVQSIEFRIEEAAYLAGIVAARASKVGILGFVGGLDVAAIRNFGCAFAQGAAAERPGTRVVARMVGTDARAFDDAARGEALAREVMDAGADVVFHAAGASGLGVLRAVDEAGVYGIGVDANQNSLYPGRILTSVLKRIDVALYTSLVALHDGSWRPGRSSVGLSEGAVGLAMDEHNRQLIDASTRTRVEETEFAIVSGELTVYRLRSEGDECPTRLELPTR